MPSDKVWAAAGLSFSKVLRARDGPKQAHMDVLVASFEKESPAAASTRPENEKPANPEERRVFIKPEIDQAEKSVG
ncbi:hypothetical protein [Marinobacter sp.]|uniref:hypothetical protein n=1 Tax=Marinobacter sp. TaxID=50741 RepID=UPI0035C6B29B